MQIWLRLRTESPVAISARPSAVGLPTETLSYISGTALRGAFAAMLTHLGVAPGSQTFNDIFLSDKSIFGNLYPTLLPDKYHGNMPDLTLPLPATALTCKQMPGFKRDANVDQVGHGVKDSLIDWLKKDTDYEVERCDVCQAELDRPGFHFYAPTSNNQFYQLAPRRRMITHTAIDARRGVARERFLYTLHTIEEGQYFAGYLTLPDPLPTEIEDILNSKIPLRIGVAKSRGLGEVAVDDWKELPAEESGVADLEQRLDDFNSKLSGLAANLLAGCSVQAGSWYACPIMFYSDAILLDAYLCPATALTPAVLLQHYQQYWPDHLRWPAQTRLLRAFTNAHTISGWNAAHQLPKWPDLAVNAGSVFVLLVPEAEKADALACLRQLELSGIGERRDEGFGQVKVGLPFHQEVKLT